MQSSLSRTLSAPLHWWRTVSITFIVGACVAALSRSAIAVLCVTLACAFVFSAHERRYWLVVPPHRLMRDVAMRCGLALGATYVLSATQFLTVLAAPFV